MNDRSRQRPTQLGELNPPLCWKQVSEKQALGSAEGRFSTSQLLPIQGGGQTQAWLPGSIGEGTHMRGDLQATVAQTLRGRSQAGPPKLAGQRQVARREKRGLT